MDGTDGTATEQRKPTAFGAIFGRMCRGSYFIGVHCSDCTVGTSDFDAQMSGIKI